MGPPVYSLASLSSLLIAPKLCTVSSFVFFSSSSSPLPFIGISELLGHINNLTSPHGEDYVTTCRCVLECVCAIGVGEVALIAAFPYVSKVIALTSVSGGTWTWCWVEGTFARTHTHTHNRISGLVCYLKQRNAPPSSLSFPGSHFLCLTGCMIMKKDSDYWIFITTALTLTTTIICLSFGRL